MSLYCSFITSPGPHCCHFPWPKLLLISFGCLWHYFGRGGAMGAALPFLMHHYRVMDEVCCVTTSMCLLDSNKFWPTWRNFGRRWYHSGHRWRRCCWFEYEAIGAVSDGMNATENISRWYCD